MPSYDKKFFDAMPGTTASSARIIVPLVLDAIHPRSVVDVGCGAGTWLAAWREHGVEDILGVDGPWVKPNQLQIPADRFRSADLVQPLDLNRTFDLVMSLEVAEHLPATAAATFVETLTRLGPVVLFSAAIPLQGGRHHLNEQWPEYWADLFEKRGFVAVDGIRKRIWENPGVEAYYAQNILLFCERGMLATNVFLKQEYAFTARTQLALVHPRQYIATRGLKSAGLLAVLLAVPGLVLQAIASRLPQRTQ